MIEHYRYTETEIKHILDSITIIIDKREQKNEHITEVYDKNKIKYIHKSMSCGDYSFFLPKNIDLGIVRDLYFLDKAIIERKNSLDELANNIGNKRTEFKNELIKGNGTRFVLMIENAEYKDIVNHNYKSSYNEKAFLGSLESFSIRYNVHLRFVQKEHSALMMYKIFYYYMRELLR